MLPPLYFNCTYVFSLQSCVPVRVKVITVKQVDRSVQTCEGVTPVMSTLLWSLLWTLWRMLIPLYLIWGSFMPMWSCSLLFAQSTLPFIHTQALSLVTWHSWKGRRSWWPRRKGSGGLGASITELESSPPIMSDQKIQMWVHILRINMQYFLSVLFCWHPALRQVEQRLMYLTEKKILSSLKC